MAGNEPADAHLVGHDVVIHMHLNDPMDRALQLSIRQGTLRDGRIDASGGFRNGRSVTLNWHKN